MLNTTETDGNPKSPEVFSRENLAAVEAIIDRYRFKPGALIPVLEEIQEVLGYIPKSIQNTVAMGLGVPLSEVWGVVTFYSFFNITPRGRHTVRCCLGTACYVRGGKNNLDKLTSLLQIGPGNTTADQRFSLETVRCVGACGLAPVVTADEETFGQVKPNHIPEILNAFT
ncbi:MAG TPA: NAD(P)H-dependent oxidoreductase subunit E [Desulfatirhabdiaceae bacterium]|nr:NAD(P)H-dependent oxidoreductase subunit E [Desulfatirhabdiaceae bacterium]